jgi:CheY-like chemotaxis protein
MSLRRGDDSMKRRPPDRGAVLIVDDDELVRWSAAAGLRESGYRVETAADPGEALELCPGAVVALLSHDHPHLDGLTLADILRRQCPRCAVVLMAADSTSELQRQARERDIVRVLAKPFSLEDLVDAIRDALGHSLVPSSPRAARAASPPDAPPETGPPHGV